MYDGISEVGQTYVDVSKLASADRTIKHNDDEFVYYRQGVNAGVVTTNTFRRNVIGPRPPDAFSALEKSVEEAAYRLALEDWEPVADRLRKHFEAYRKDIGR